MWRLLAFAVLWLFVFGTALAGGWSVMFKVSYLLLLLLAAGWLWTRLSLRSLEIRREPLAVRTQVGSVVEERLTIVNRSLLPKPWLDVQAASALSPYVAHFFVSLAGRREWSTRLETPARQRGSYLLGPTTVTAGDPFGFFQTRATLAGEKTVLVYPATHDLPNFRPLEGELAGGGRRRERVPFATAMATGLRDYQPGDPFNRIHWPNSARLGRLMVKEFEQDPVSDVWVVLDLDRNVHHDAGPLSAEEQGVEIAASLARHFLLQNRAVGLLTQRHVLEPDRGTRQLLKVLELLAVVRVRDWQGIDALLLANGARFMRGTSAIVVTPTPRTNWLAAVEDLRMRGVRTAAVLQEPVVQGSAQSTMALVGELAAANVPCYLVKPGQALDQALAEPHATGAVAGRF